MEKREVFSLTNDGHELSIYRSGDLLFFKITNLRKPAWQEMYFQTIEDVQKIVDVISSDITKGMDLKTIIRF